MSEPIPGTRNVLIGRLVAAPVLKTTPGGGRIAILRVSVRNTHQYDLIAFGRLVNGLNALTAGSLIYAEGRWQAREGAPPELVVDVLTLLAANRPIT